MRSLISITNYDDYALDIIGNNFTSNSGTKGIIYLDLLNKVPSAATGGRVLIASNNFTLNAGFFDSNVIFIRARGPTTGSIYTIIPSDGNVFCSGYRFDSNIFYQNFGCQGSAGGVIKFECVDSG